MTARRQPPVVLHAADQGGISLTPMFGSRRLTTLLNAGRSALLCPLGALRRPQSLGRRARNSFFTRLSGSAEAEFPPKHQIARYALGMIQH